MSKKDNRRDTGRCCRFKLTHMVAKCYHGKVARPKYPPSLVAELAADERTRSITMVASNSAAGMGLSNAVVWDILMRLSDYRFIKTVDSERCPGQLLDVWDVEFEGKQIYLKVKVMSDPPTRKVVVVLSFKPNEYYMR